MSVLRRTPHREDRVTHESPARAIIEDEQIRQLWSVVFGTVEFFVCFFFSDFQFSIFGAVVDDAHRELGYVTGLTSR